MKIKKLLQQTSYVEGNSMRNNLIIIKVGELDWCAILSERNKHVLIIYFTIQCPLRPNPLRLSVSLAHGIINFYIIMSESCILNNEVHDHFTIQSHLFHSRKGNNHVYYYYNIFIHAYKYIACKMCSVLNMVHIYKNKYI